MLTSEVQRRGRVPFPAFEGERVYMRPFIKASGLPSDLSRWQPTVDAMLAGVETDLPIYLMVDQAFVRAGKEHRRPGLHVDMYWHPELLAHGGGGRHWHRPGRHQGHPVPSHHDFPEEQREPVKKPSDPKKEALLLASDVLGCRAWVGPFEGDRGKGGEYGLIDASRLAPLEMLPGLVYAGHTMTMLHESIPLVADAHRTVVRLNVPGWAPC